MQECCTSEREGSSTTTWLSLLLLCVALGVFAMKKRESLAAKCSKQERAERGSTEEQAAKSTENPSAQ